MWLVFMTTTLASDDPLPLLRNAVLGRPSSRPVGPAPPLAGRVHAAMKHDGTRDGVVAARGTPSVSSPTTLLKVRLKVPRLANPTSHATSVTGRSVWRSSVIARSTRRRWR